MLLIARVASSSRGSALERPPSSRGSLHFLSHRFRLPAFMYAASPVRSPYAGPEHKSSVADRNPETIETLLGATKTATAVVAAATMTIDEEERPPKEEKRARVGGREKKVSLDEGDGRRSSCFVWSRPCTMQNSASNSKAVRQSAASLFARCESSRFFRGRGEGANRSLNPNERLRARKRERKQERNSQSENNAERDIQWARTVDRCGAAPCPTNFGGRPTQAIVITKMSNI